MTGMIDPLGEGLAALEATFHPAAPGIIRTQPIDVRLAALKTAASFLQETQMVDPIGDDITVLGGVNAAAGMPPAPAAYHWDFVTSADNGGQRVTSADNNNQFVVALVANGS